MRAPSAKPFCAICGDDKLPLSRQRLGPSEPEVLVCSDCDAPATARTGPERGYPIPDGPRIGSLSVAAAKAANRVTGPVVYSPSGVFGEQKRDGFIVVRVPRWLNGAPIDAQEARETLRDKPWFAELRHKGSTVRYHLFDRPDPEAVPRSRSRPAGDVLGELARAAGKEQPR